MPGLMSSRFSSGGREESFYCGIDAKVIPGTTDCYLPAFAWSKGFPDVCPGI